MTSELVSAVINTPNWLSAILGGGVGAGGAKLISAWQSARTAVRADQRADFDRITAEYRSMVDRMTGELNALKQRVADLEARHNECVEKNIELSAQVNDLHRELQTLKTRTTDNTAKIARSARRARR